jgi:hypothetical protein
MGTGERGDAGFAEDVHGLVVWVVRQTPAGSRRNPRLIAEGAGDVVGDRRCLASDFERVMAGSPDGRITPGAGMPSGSKISLSRPKRLTISS